MTTAILIIIIGVFIFWGHYLSGMFERKSIPDVLGLMLLGMLLGPVFKFVDPDSFGKMGPLFSNLVLIFILFESGTDLKISEIKSSFKESAGITTLSFLITWLAGFILSIIIFDLSWVSCLFIGATLGGTSSAVVVGLVKKIAVKPKTATTLIMESAESDVFTLAIPLGILGFMITGEMEASAIISQFISSLVLALIIGIGGAFLWSFIISKIPTLKTTSFSTPAFLFILYGVAEYLKFSGPLTALSFGIAIGNLQYFEPKILENIIPNKSIMLPQKERDFFSEIVFLLRIFFFVYIGIKMQIDRIDLLLWGAFITLILFAVRIIAVKIVAANDSPMLDKAVMSIMIPKGLGAAVIATLPLQEGHTDGIIIQSICFSVILFSTLYCVGLFFMIKTGVSLPFYARLFGKNKVAEE
ncbi:MAG: cation:proton antiporter [Chitinophagales bacterium]|jgi:NhaP-type Na+/H+ or K+/H+ antiporter|nr:cation:proton antiporter [Bacteroidota bacterium]MBP8915864.1 cation:proton antiporter [Chitinophagales bacterium]MBP9220619.1 cation:proton antiporter [Chitinophagales bacterium]MBP9794720.1 cation:proton antiporter [Chitinophagales bacterium]